MSRLVLSHGTFVLYCSYVFYHFYTHLLSSTSEDTTILVTESLSFWIQDRILFLKIWIFKSREKSKVPQAWKLSAVVCFTFGLACSRLQDGGENGSNEKRCENRVRTGERGLLARFFAVCGLFSLIYTDWDPGTGYLCVDDAYFNKKNKRLFWVQKFIELKLRSKVVGRCLGAFRSDFSQ